MFLYECYIVLSSYVSTWAIQAADFVFAKILHRAKVVNIMPLHENFLLLPFVEL
jgi:hypothetical protein